MTDQPIKTFVNWSGGKDCALALYRTMQHGYYSPQALITNFYRSERHVAMHRVPEVLVEQQAANIGLPLMKVLLPYQPSMQEYEQSTANLCRQLSADQFTHSLYGDIFLEDLKEYREAQMKKQGMQCVFPLWQQDSRMLLAEFIQLGFKAVVVCVNERFLQKNFAGRLIDESFLDDLPADVDACGENGEFHTFVFDGPIFSKPVLFNVVNTYYAEMDAPVLAGQSAGTQPEKPTTGFWFCRLGIVG